MRKLIVLFMILITAAVSLSACGNHANREDGYNGTTGPGGPGNSGNGGPIFHYGENTAISPSWYYKIAREVQEDGRVWTFQYYDFKDPDEDNSSLIHYSFFDFNMRYKDHSRSAAEKRDMNLIDTVILDNDRSVEELLALSSDDYEFEAIDKEMFFRLMRQALTGEVHKEGNDQAYWDKMSQYLLIEPEYIGGYKFQIAYMNCAACIDEFYIDILYQTGKGYSDYVQLSDLVENGTATEEQSQAFEKIRTIAGNIKENDSYFANAEDWKNLEIAGIDFARLYTMLDRLYWNDEAKYRPETAAEMLEGVE